MKFLCLVFTLLCALSAFAATSKSVFYKSGGRYRAGVDLHT
jgi:hypothetical protein